MPIIAPIRLTVELLIRTMELEGNTAPSQR